jgi:starvation-inducible outer membrane lipoprotein
MKTLWIAPLLLTLAGCASLASQNDPAVDLADAQVAVRTEPNGDVIEEYRVAGQLRMVKVTPSRGAATAEVDKGVRISTTGVP